MTDYKGLCAQADAMIGAETDLIANMANFSALVFNAVEGLNWAGFYLVKDGELVVGPFQGKPACVRIALGAGVCGTAAAERKTIVVDDVHQFDGHIACDVASRSEIVVPLIANDDIRGVFDVDSPHHARFVDADKVGMEALVATFLRHARL